MECVKIEHSDGIEIRKIRDINGDFSRLYREKGKLLPRLILEGYYIEQMKAFRSLDKDLRNILSWVKILNDLNDRNGFRENLYPGMDNEDAVISKALYFAILTLYGRCFTGAQSRKFTFDKKHVPEKYRELHEELMYSRHNFAAHKGDFDVEDCQIALVVNINKHQLRPTFFSELQQPYIAHSLLGTEDGNAVVNLCDALRNIATEKYSDICDKISEGFVRKTPLAFWKHANGKTVNIDSYFKK
ncbi:hypothetical protein ACJYFV_14750 [Enterobacter asburiae]|uniref:hypothetical protein n=1 Tax=Enterobacter asburiae TaxID=61645 RepID=UPI003F740221